MKPSLYERKFNYLNHEYKTLRLAKFFSSLIKHSHQVLPMSQNDRLFLNLIQYIFSLAVYWTYRIPVHPSKIMIFINVDSSQPTGRLPPPPYPQQYQKKLINRKIQQGVWPFFHTNFRFFRVVFSTILPLLNDCWGILSPWLKKTLSFTALICSRMKDFEWLLGNTFTMVEENFEFYCSEMLQNKGFPAIVKGYFHHGWRKFRVLLLWNAPE